MTTPFARHEAGVVLRLDPEEAELLTVVPPLLEDVQSDEPAGRRLAPNAYADDSFAAAEFEKMAGTDLQRARRADRASFAGSLQPGEQILSLADAEAWLRVLGEARLVLAARLGIEHEGWHADDFGGDPRAAVLHYLSYLQDELVTTLLAGLDEAD